MILLLACRPAAWSESSALLPHLARLDRDGDGRVTADDYAATRWKGPTFDAVDRDADGVLSVAELGALLRTTSPTAFDGEVTAPRTGDPAPASDQGNPVPTSTATSPGISASE
jgi:hypothetical protein